MARNRMIKAEFWADEVIGSCSLIAQLLFIGSWNFADDSGVCRANSAYLRNNIFPYSSLTVKQIEDALFQLKQKGLILLGEFKNEKYLLIKNFLKHQTIKKPSSFRYVTISYEEVFGVECPPSSPPPPPKFPPKVKGKGKENTPPISPSKSEEPKKEDFSSSVLKPKTEDFKTRRRALVDKMCKKPRKEWGPEDLIKNDTG